jgi:hypothetical protein
LRAGVTIDSMKKAEGQSARFVVCLNNEGYKASLEVGKLYRFIPDDEAEAEGLIRVVDESGEDYAFDAARFHPVNLPATVEKALLDASPA